MLQNLSGWHALVILAIVLLVFGSSKLPLLAKSLGQSVRILKEEVHDSDEDENVQVRTPAVAADKADDGTVVATTSIDPVSGRRAS